MGTFRCEDLQLKYIAKPNTWFKAGTTVTLIDDYRPDGLDVGLFEGLRICEDEASEGCPVNTERDGDQEVCGFDEFDVIE